MKRFSVTVNGVAYDVTVEEVGGVASAPVAAPAVAPAPVQDDGQLIAVITAAVAATIEADPALSSQFASGFRVVSFKKTEKTRNR